jgi:hypothetical protein
MPKRTVSDVPAALIPKLVADNIPAQWQEDARQHLEGMLLSQVFEPYRREVAALEGDGDLTEQGRGKAHMKLLEAAIGRLANFESGYPTKLRNRLADTERAFQRTATAASKPSDPADRLEFVLRLQEIRRALEPLSQEERYNIAVKAEDPHVLNAILDAPPSVTKARPDALPALTPFIKPEHRDEVLMRRAEALDPKAAAELRDLRQTVEVYTLAVKSVRAAIEESSPANRIAFNNPATGNRMPTPPMTRQ